MSEQANELNFQDSEGADIYDFSWDIMTEDVVNAEISYMNQQIYKVTKLIPGVTSENNYLATAKEYGDLMNTQLGRNSPVQQYYYANQSYFSPYMKSDSKPSGFYDMPVEKQKLFNFALACQRDAAQTCQPLDQMRMLMLKVPLFHAFKITQATMLLDDAGFNEDLYDETNTYIKEIAQHVSRNQTWMKNACDRESERYFKENYGKMSPNDLNPGYRKARLRDYKITFEAYCNHATEYFTCNDYCVYSVNLQYLMCMQVIDEYMEVVAEALKDDIISKLENCMAESKKLGAVIISRHEKCTTDIFRSVTTALEGLNNEIYSYCEYALNVANNYKNLISAAPYCFMKKPPACDNLPMQHGFKQFRSDPLSSGTNYREIIASAQDALTRHCRDYVYSQGRKEMS